MKRKIFTESKGICLYTTYDAKDYRLYSGRAYKEFDTYATFYMRSLQQIKITPGSVHSVQKQKFLDVTSFANTNIFAYVAKFTPFTDYYHTKVAMSDLVNDKTESNNNIMKLYYRYSFAKDNELNKSLVEKGLSKSYILYNKFLAEGYEPKEDIEHFFEKWDRESFSLQDYSYTSNSLYLAKEGELDYMNLSGENPVCEEEHYGVHG